MHLVAVAPQIEAHEVAGSEFVAGHADHGDAFFAEGAEDQFLCLVGGESMSALLRCFECLAEIPDQIVRVFNTDGEPDGTGTDPGRSQLFVGELSVCGACRVDDQRSWRLRRWPDARRGREIR